MLYKMYCTECLKITPILFNCIFGGSIEHDLSKKLPLKVSTFWIILSKYQNKWFSLLIHNYNSLSHLRKNTIFCKPKLVSESQLVNQHFAALHDISYTHRARYTYIWNVTHIKHCNMEKGYCWNIAKKIVWISF